MDGTGQALQAALAHHQAGRLAEAKTLYDAILTAQPGQPDALHFLGLLACQLKQYGAGLALMEQSLVARPDASYFNNLGNMLRESGRLDDAIAHYRRAVGLRPDYPEAHNNLGNALRDAREPAAAMKSCTRAIELRPGYAEAYNNLGNALQDLDDLDGAATHYGRAIELDPSMAMAHANLSAVRHRQLRCAEALVHAQDAIRLAPNLAEAHNHAGNAYHGLDRLDEAQASHRTAVTLNPADAGACHNLSVVLLKLQRLDEALVYCRQALQAGPPAVLMHVNLGDILRAQGNVDAAVHAYRDALALVRDDADDVAATVLNRLLFSAAASACVNPTDYLADARRYGRHLAARSTRHAHDPRERAARAQGRPLRVGFVSGDLRLHPVGIFLESVLAHLDRTRIDLRVYVTTDVEDAITAKLKPHSSAWRSIAALGPEAAARMIHEDEIDVLVDLAGHTQSSGLALFGWKPAPVQASWLGFFASTGCDAIDYFIGDRYTLPDAEAHHFVEQPWRLPDSFLCFTPPACDVEVGPLPMAARGHPTFGCFGQLVKIGDDVVRAWSRILHTLPDARLLLKAHELGREGVRDATVARFTRHGIDADRLILEGGSPRAEYFDAYNRIDVALSPFPYPGGTTTAEALWMGVPVLGMKGSRFVTHICESVLHAAGMGEWVADGEDTYVAKAIAAVRDREPLATLRAGLRAQLLASPL
ncbi:tetratricopeptide repeat protein, partial [Burkholderia sp. Tr-849]